ncbi:MAG: cation-translocating P-type ATPase [Patescibacteria group bacterium]|nr:cation-translocating P-type ATPase [Patescibacteria group bacterium]
MHAVKKTIGPWFASPRREYVIGGALLVLLVADLLLPQVKPAMLLFAAVGAIPTIVRAVQSVRDRHVTIDTFNIFAIGASFIVVDARSAAFIILMLTFADGLDWYTESRTHNAVRELLRLKPTTAVRERGGAMEEVPIGEIAQGDVVVVKAGSYVPVDGVVVFGSASVNEAAVTGESVPVAKVTGDHVLSSTLNESGTMKVRATRVGKESTIERMAALIREASRNKSRTEKLADRFAAIFLPIVLVIAGGAYALTRNISMTAAIFLVACADDMAVAIPLAVTAAVGYAAKRGFIVKGSAWLDALGKIHTLVLDKTGTLTYGTFEVRAAEIASLVTPEAFWGAVGSAEKYSEHPIGRSLFHEALKHAPDVPDPADVATYKGSGVAVMAAGHRIVVGNERVFDDEKMLFPEAARSRYVAMQKQYGETVSLVVRDGVFWGMIAVADVPRPDAKATLAQMKTLGIQRIVMFTGDNAEVAARVSTALGIDEYRASMKPEDKLAGLDEFEKRGTVAMVGDGINDAPSLARASVGIAMGKGGTAVAVEAADVVILTDRLERLPEMVELGRRTSSVIRGDMAIWFISNLVGFALVLTGIAGPAFAAFYNFATDFFPLFNSTRLFRHVRRVKNRKAA